MQTFLQVWGGLPWSVVGWSYSIETEASSRHVYIVWSGGGYNYTRLAGPSAPCQTGALPPPHLLFHPGPLIQFHRVSSLYISDPTGRDISYLWLNPPQMVKPFTKPDKNREAGQIIVFLSNLKCISRESNELKQHSY